MIRVTSSEEYHDLRQKAGSVLGLVVHFAAEWCDPCKVVTEFLESQAVEYKEKVIFAEVDCDAHGDICEEEEVTSVPFISFYRTSIAEPIVEKVADVAGAKLDLIKMNLHSIYGDNGARGNQRCDFATLGDYLGYLTKRPGVVLFITGTPSHPRCGFTGKLCELVQELQVPFVFYDVMASDEVCEGLKVYSNWPTYPQVYVSGSLIGGYDVCKQLHEEGELKSTLTP